MKTGAGSYRKRHILTRARPETGVVRDPPIRRWLDASQARFRLEAPKFLWTDSGKRAILTMDILLNMVFLRRRTLKTVWLSDLAGVTGTSPTWERRRRLPGVVRRR